MSLRRVQTSPNSWSSSLLMLVVVVLDAVRVATGQTMQCVGSNGCSCTLDDGRVIDVTSLGKTDGSAYFQDVQGEDSYKYSFNPCTPFTEGNCNNAAVCQVSSDSTLQYLVGEQSSAQWSYDGQNVKVYYMSYSDAFRQAWVTYICDPSATTPTMHALGEEEPTVYYLEVITACGCPDGCSASGPPSNESEGLSGGSILLIVAFVLLVVYLAGGMIYNKTRREAQGLDILPNISFWKALPGLVKDGCGFVCGKFSGKKKEYEEV